MIVFEYHLRNYFQFLQDFSSSLNIAIEDDTIHLAPPLGTGFASALELSKELNVLIYQFQLNEDLLLLRKKDQIEYYTLIFERIEHSDDFAMKIGPQSLLVEKGKRSALYLTSFLYELSYLYPRQSMVQGVRILIPPAWMKTNLGLSGTDDVLKKYIEMKTNGVLVNAVGPESKRIFEELVEPAGVEKNLLFYKVRVLKIIEQFSIWLHRTADTIPVLKDINKADIENIIRTEAGLVSDLSKAPPGIDELSKIAGMSASKFKSCFKKIYGIPPYSYFQKHRMEKAYQMLLTGEHSIKDVGYSMGYTNLSNFSLAFKKHFRKLPSELQKV
jgi:AraC-like DNA-binding protein